MLGFIRTFYAEHRVGPSHSEIAAALKTNRTRVQAAVRQLAREGRIHRVPGKARGIRPIESMEEALYLLKAEGWTVNVKRLELGHPVLDLIILDLKDAVTNPSLPPPAMLDHIPDVEIGEKRHGGNEQR